MGYIFDAIVALALVVPPYLTFAFAFHIWDQPWPISIFRRAIVTALTSAFFYIIVMSITYMLFFAARELFISANWYNGGFYAENVSDTLRVPWTTIILMPVTEMPTSAGFFWEELQLYLPVFALIVSARAWLRRRHR